MRTRCMPDRLTNHLHRGARHLAHHSDLVAIDHGAKGIHRTAMRKSGKFVVIIQLFNKYRGPRQSITDDDVLHRGSPAFHGVLLMLDQRKAFRQLSDFPA